jgi:tetratricopeptide (TPR) repeat protein
MELDAVYRAIEAGDYASAEARLASLAYRMPENRSYPVLRSAVLLSMGRIDDARTALKSELAAWPDNLEALFALAELERFAGNTKAHRAAIEALVVKDPENADAQAALGDIHYESKNYTKAEASYAAALKLAPANVEALLGSARLKFKRDDMKGALVALDKAVAAAPGDAIAYLDRSRVLYQLGRYVECEADMDTAIRLAPGSAWNYVERGRLYLDTGRLEMARADLDRSINLNPEYFLAYVYRASIHENSGDDAAALADYRTASRLYPDYWYSFESMGVLAYRLGYWSEAYAAFDKASNYTKAHTEYYIAAALSLMRAGDVKAAKDYASKKLAKVDKEKSSGQWLALRLLFDQGDMTSELEVRINAEKNLDLKAGLLYYLGAYWVARGKPDLGSKYIRMSYDSERMGTIERRLAEADLARLATPN